MDHIMNFVGVVALKFSGVLLNLEMVCSILTWYFLGPAEFKMNKKYIKYESTKYK